MGELFATDPGAPAAAQPAGIGMTVLPGSELSAGIAPATLKLARGGQIRICSQSQLTINTGNQGLLLAMSAGSLEINYRLEQSASDLVVTPDFNLRLAGPGSYHFALGVNGRGDTCLKPLPGNTAGIVLSEPLGSDQVGIGAEEAVFFPAGKLSGRSSLDRSCGCPITTASGLTASAQPQATPRQEDIGTERVLVANQEVASSPPDQPGQNHLQVETPFVFSGNSAALPGAVAQIEYSSLPNVFLVQDEVDPVVLAVKPPEPAVAKRETASPAKQQTATAAKPEKKTSRKTETAPAARPETTPSDETEKPSATKTEEADPRKEPEKKKEKKGFVSRVKGFFGSLFHH